MNSPQPALGPLLWQPSTRGSYRFWLWCQPRFSEPTGVVDEFLLTSPCLQLDFEFGWNPHVMWRISACQTRHGKHSLVAPIDWTLTTKVGPVVEASSNWSLKLPVISTINNHYIWQCMASWTIPIIHLYIPSYLLFKALRIHHQASVAASASWPVVALPSAASPAGFQQHFEFGLAKNLKRQLK